MFEKLQMLDTAGRLAAHASARQAEIAKNVANADTPGYRARDLPSFADTYRQDALPMKATRPEHLRGLDQDSPVRSVLAPDQESPDGNSVSLEDQMVKAAEVRNQHDMALAVYSSALGILRTSLGRG